VKDSKKMTLELPLFPLQTVLFPGNPLLLHIFEDRYQRMIRLCLETRQPFGVVLIRRGVEALGPLAEPHPIGCTALITHVQSLGEGRMNITTVGEERFRILSLHADTAPYWIGEVEYFPLVNPAPATFSRGVEDLRPLVIRYLQLLAQTGKMKIDLNKLPEERLLFTYTAASLLQVPPADKQELLSIEDALSLVERLRLFYRREAAILRSILSHGGPDDSKKPSVN
jgi:Lon protease-like protein